MINLSNLKSHKGARKRRKIVGRGLGSGHGTYSGRGAKGQKARTGGKICAGFEGGRMPLMRQVPKARGKGFKGALVKTQEVTLSDLAAHFGDGEAVTGQSLFERGLVKDKRKVKILATGDLGSRKVIVEGVKLTKGARSAIEKAGGQIRNEESEIINKE